MNREDADANGAARQRVSQAKTLHPSIPSTILILGFPVRTPPQERRHLNAC